MKNVLILGAGGQIARHVINQLADKQTIKQTLFARQPAKIHKPYPTLKMQFARRELKRRFHIYRQPGRSVKIGETDLRHQR